MKSKDQQLLEEAYKSISSATKQKNKPLLTCDDCGKKTVDVKKTICPFADDVLNKKVPATLCKKCYEERSADI